MTMDIQEIMALLPHRYPFLYVDRILELEPGERALARKCVSVNEPYFQGHFPGNPILPGVVVTEAFAQVAGVVALSSAPDRANEGVALLGLDKVRFRKPIRPGDVMEIEVTKDHERKDVWRFRCEARVDGQKVAEGMLTATVGAV